MSDLLGLLLPLTFLLGLGVYLVRGGLPSFSPRRANATFRSAQGPLAATWLALVAGSWGLLDLAGEGWFPTTSPGLLATVVLAAVVGVVTAPRVTVFAMSVIGLGAQFLSIAEDQGAVVAVALVVITGMITWLFGATRGLLAPSLRAGMAIAVALVVAVVIAAASGALTVGPGGRTARPGTPAGVGAP